MKISKIFPFFFLLYVIEILLIVYASENLYSIENDLEPLKNIDETLAERKKKKKIYYSLISSSIFVFAAVALGIGFYINQKEENSFKKYTQFKNRKFNFENPRDGQVPSTSREYVEPKGINKVDIKGPLVENTNENDVPLKKFNIFLDNARIALKYHFNNLSLTQQEYYMNDPDYIRKVLQSLGDKRNVHLSRNQEDMAVLNMRDFLNKHHND
ncbi:early transcribed membrane protein [Plasmodium gonderi]|uniref:Early transcribed membrane protein n=1 Tax=Plasmodium gonderi TaxID=77519 RepID=A0A1Y1JLY5_PLAGO|nr:early transcribed membrane protein [Plasmodium gonderi]GAW83230.1 early transcribed membrane protein [Plasmodium gonderi]